MKHYLTEDQKKFILSNHTELTAYQLAVKTKTSVVEVKEFCKENNIETRKAKSHRSGYYIAKIKKTVVKTKETSFIRPPAEYNNLPSPFGLATEMHAGRDLV